MKNFSTNCHQNQKQRLIRDIGKPARGGNDEQPAAINEGCNHAIFSRPCPTGLRGDDIAISFGGRRRRIAKRPRLDAQMHDGVQHPQRLVVGNMFCAWLGRI